MHKEGIEINYMNDLIKNYKNELIIYKPYIIDADVLTTNMIFKHLTNDNCAEWHNPQIYKNVFGKIQHFNGNKFAFEKLAEHTPSNQKKSLFNDILRRYSTEKINKKIIENKGITNIWIVIENPLNLKLNNIIQCIYLEYGGQCIHRFNTSDIENEINILAYIFKHEGIQYKNNKIYVPLIIPHNAFIFLGSYHSSMLYIVYVDNIEDITYKIYGNIIDNSAFPIISNTNHLTNRCEFIYYKLQYTGTQKILSTQTKLKIHFMHPTYVMYLMNVSREYVQSIKLFINFLYDSSKQYYEFTDIQIEWFDNHAIIWINKDFLIPEKINEKVVNFSRCDNPYLIIENTYENTQQVELLAVSSNILRHISGMAGLRFGT